MTAMGPKAVVRGDQLHRLLRTHPLPRRCYQPIGRCVRGTELMTAKRLVLYERVSTVRQGASGLGLEAQRKVIEDFAASKWGEVLARLNEVESGRKGPTGPNS